jgi:DNA modification methylase
MASISSVSLLPNLLPIESDFEMHPPYRKIYCSDARSLPDEIAPNSVDLVVTSPPYWRKRNYGVEGQIGQERSPSEYVSAIMRVMQECYRVLRPSGSLFLNIGDTYWNKSLQGIPSLVEVSAREAGWKLRNRIIWIKKIGMPDPVQDRLA